MLVELQKGNVTFYYKATVSWLDIHVVLTKLSEI